MIKGIAKAELLFILAMVGGFLIPPAIFGQWWLFSVFMLFFICFGIVEFIAEKKTGNTVSQHFWILSETNKTGAIIILVGMLVAWIGLLWHLGCKLF